MTASEYPWPPIEGGLQPEWTGTAFCVGGAEVTVLAYSGGQSGWSNALTKMHEDSAGADHPIDRLSRRWALAAVRRHMKDIAPVLLEVGCSSGFLLQDLRAEWPMATLIGSDFLKEPLERVAGRMRSIPLLQFDAARCPLPDVSVDAVLLLNVLEHIEEDGAALRQVARILKPGGIAVVEVPAGPHLYDVYDEHLLHYRRYSMRTLALQIRAAGLTVLEKSHLGCTVYPAFAFVKRRNRRLASADPDLKRRVVEANIKRTRNSWFLNGLLRWEAWLGRYVSYPFGIRCVAVGKKIRSGRVILR